MELDREKIDQFIKEGMASDYEEFPIGLLMFIKRRLEGESYSKLASGLEISSGKIVELIDDYRSKVAPLAEKWWEWKGSRKNTYPPLDEEDGEPKPDKESDNDSEEGAAYYIGS